MTDPVRTALEAMIDRLEEIEDASIAASAASVSAWKTVHELESFISSAKAEISADVSAGVVSQESASYALKLLSRAHKSATASAISSDAKKNECRGSLDVLKWATTIVGEACDSLKNTTRPATNSEVASDIVARKTRAKPQ